MTNTCPNAAGVEDVPATHVPEAPRGAHDLELLSPSIVADPYPAYAELRAQGPVVHVPEHDLWLVTTYDACLEVLSDPARFSSREALSGRNLFRDNPEAAAKLRGGPGYPRKPTLILTDPPQHTRYRSIVQKAFAPAKTIKRLVPVMEEIVDELIDAFIEQGHCDFVADFAVPLPMRVVSAVLGMPADMRATLKRWSDDFIAAQAGNIDSDRVHQAAESTREFEHYISDLIDDRASAPDLHDRLDFLSRLVVEGAATDDYPELTRQEQLSLVQQMLVGGNETTTNLLGNAMALLLDNPEWVVRLRNDTALVPDFIEEALRHESPLQGLFRVAADATNIQGVHVPAGAKLMVLFGSANRDEAVYTPAGFDPSRDNRSFPHLAFGRGTHACMGQGLARREVVIAITRLIQRLDDIRMAEGADAEPVALFGFHGRRSLEITFKAAETA